MIRQRSMKAPRQRSRKVILFGIQFDSEAEARRYLYLRDLLERGEITDLVVHPTYVLQPECRRDGGEAEVLIREIKFLPDFAYAWHGRQIVEDVKAFRTIRGKRVPVVQEDAELKVKIFRYQHPEVSFCFVEA